MTKIAFWLVKNNVTKKQIGGSKQVQYWNDVNGNSYVIGFQVNQSGPSWRYFQPIKFHDLEILFFKFEMYVRDRKWKIKDIVDESV